MMEKKLFVKVVEEKHHLKTDIVLSKVNESTLFVDCSHEISRELYKYFSALAPNYQFSPKYKQRDTQGNRKWNGKIYFFDIYKNYLPVGLYFKISQFAKAGGYSISSTYRNKEEIVYQDFLEFVQRLHLKDDDGNPLVTRDFQLQAAYEAIKYRILNIGSVTGCHKAGDMILMNTGIWKKVEDITIGEYVFGEDGRFKKVLNTFTGQDKLCKIIPKNNRDSITVNENHILPLKRSDYSKPYSITKGDKHYIQNMEVKTYIESKKTFKHIANIFYNDKELNFEHETDLSYIKLTPYFIGLYLGDGSTYSCQVTNEDIESQKEIYIQANMLECEVITKDNLHFDIKGCIGTKGQGVGKNRNVIFKEFEKMGIIFSSNSKKNVKCADRFIPEPIFTTSIDYRLDVLAGLIDSDGHLANGTAYELTFKSKQLRDDVKRLSISLGIVCSTRTKYNKKYDRNYYQVLLMGNIRKIPVRILRKRSFKESLTRIDPYRSKFDVEYDGYSGNYYGIQVEDNLYITNGGMITHNSGKSAILYMIIRWFEQYDKQIVVIVNQIQLVEQLISDFRNYGWEEVDIKVDRVYGGTERHSDRKIIFSTWQSTYTDLEQFARFDVLICDEADTTAAKCISMITKACINASTRIGCSGSYPDEGTCEWFTIVGALGPIKTYSTYKSLQDVGQLSQMKLNLVRLVYPEEIKMKNYKENVEPYLKETKKCAEIEETTVGYNKEMDLVHESVERNMFICKLISNINGNSLVLFTKKAKHGYIIREIVTKYFPDKKIIYLDGDIDISEREDIRNLIELRNDIILIASYGVFARGINVKNLHNIIMASNYKKKGKILQAIGRGLRLHKDKEYLNIFDLIDDLIIKIDKPNRIRYTNHSVRQFAERAKIYVAQEFDYKLSQYQIKTGNL